MTNGYGVIGKMTDLEEMTHTVLQRLVLRLQQTHILNHFLGDGLPKIATARSGNVIGGGDWSEDRIIPDCIRSYSKGDKLEIRNPEATRSWMHVLTH